MKAIIFDFDGVIHDTLIISYNVSNKVNGDMSLDMYKDMFDGNLYAHKIISKEKSLAYFELTGPEYTKLIIKDYVREELLKLKEKYSLFIITSNTEKILHNYLDNNHLSHVFKDILGVETHTSKVEKFKMLFNKYGFNTNDCVFITDTLGDILEANKLGIDTIAVDFGFHERERLEKGHPKKIVSHFKDIPLAIEEIAQSRN